MDEDLGGLGEGPPKFEMGTAHVYVPQIFGKGVIHTLYIMISLQKVCHCIFVFQAKYFPNGEITLKRLLEYWAEK